MILNKEQFLSNAISIYVKLFFRAMEENREEELPEYELI
jgi:CRISP-associated protein Cas1